MGRKNKTERCVEWEGGAKQRNVVIGRTKQRDVLGVKVEQNRETC